MRFQVDGPWLRASDEVRVDNGDSVHSFKLGARLVVAKVSLGIGYYTVLCGFID